VTEGTLHAHARGAGTLTTLWCELAWLGGPEPQERVLVELEGERIVAVAAGEAAPAGALSLPGLTLPGLANAHSHSFQRALRGRTQRARGGSFWRWREQMYELADTIDAEVFEALARATFAEMALAGVTLVGEFHYLHHNRDGTPYAEPNLLGESVIRAAAAAGIRLTLLDTCYLEGGLPRFRDPDANAWAARVSQLRSSALARVGAAIHSVRAVDPAGARVVAGLAVRRGWPLHAHVSEQRRENEACLAEHGITPAELLEGAGALEANFTAVHATHLADADIARLGGARACICMCPTTERDLADGIGPACALAGAGASLALGSDSHACIDLFEEARAVELDERLATGTRGSHSPLALARAATAGGYASLGWPAGGRIEPGALADLVTVALDSPRLAGTRHRDALDATVFAAAAGDVRSVIVGGRQVVRDGAHVTLDVATELQAAIGAL
jgi:formiminoglutamate deiminase